MYGLGWFAWPNLWKITSPLAWGLFMASFGSGVTCSQNNQIMRKIQEYENNLNDYFESVKGDIESTEKVKDFFAKVEKMLTGEKPFQQAE